LLPNICKAGVENFLSAAGGISEFFLDLVVESQQKDLWTTLRPYWAHVTTFAIVHSWWFLLSSLFCRVRGDGSI